MVKHTNLIGFTNDLIILIDKDGNEQMTPSYLLKTCYKVVRNTTREDKEKLVNGVITPFVNQYED